MKTLLMVWTIILVGCMPKYPTFVENTDVHKKSSQAPFFHGVASGDPTSTSVIIWTRVTPETKLPEIPVRWEVAKDNSFQDVVSSGAMNTSFDRDYTIKVDVSELDPGKTYYYRFAAFDKKSPTGVTKTTPTEADAINLVVVSCSNYEFGYFNGYGAIAEEQNVDAVLHLGDYIYEYAPGTYGDTTIGRVHIPAKELIELQDYRDRYAQYRLDPDLQAAHGRHPFITIWDDHEISNNSYIDGAQNHQENEGDYQTRRAAAVKAYYEWMPVRESKNLYRSFSFGEQVDLIMLDERLAGRTRPADSLADPILQDPAHSMLGVEQMNWLESQLTESQARWKVIGNQVIFSYLNRSDERIRLNMDSWDGYPGDQERIANIIQGREIENVVFVTGDTHSSWAFEVTHQPHDAYDPATSEGAYALEFGTTSINSANSNESRSDEDVFAFEQKIVNTSINPHLKYANLRDHGYLLVHLDDDRVQATWKYLKTLRQRDRTIGQSVTLKAESGSTRLLME